MLLCLRLVPLRPLSFPETPQQNPKAPRNPSQPLGWVTSKGSRSTDILYSVKVSGHAHVAPWPTLAPTHKALTRLPPHLIPRRHLTSPWVPSLTQLNCGQMLFQSGLEFSKGKQRKPDAKHTSMIAGHNSLRTVWLGQLKTH